MHTVAFQPSAWSTQTGRSYPKQGRKHVVIPPIAPQKLHLNNNHTFDSHPVPRYDDWLHPSISFLDSARADIVR